MLWSAGVPRRLWKTHLFPWPNSHKRRVSSACQGCVGVERHVNLLVLFQLHNTTFVNYTAEMQYTVLVQIVRLQGSSFLASATKQCNQQSESASRLLQSANDATALFRGQFSPYHLATVSFGKSNFVQPTIWARDVLVLNREVRDYKAARFRARTLIAIARVFCLCSPNNGRTICLIVATLSFTSETWTIRSI